MTLSAKIETASDAPTGQAGDVAGLDPSALRVLSGAAWFEFCDQLKQAAAPVFAASAPATVLDRAEAWRCLARFARLGLTMMVECADPDFPQFYAASDETIKVFLPNPDNCYRNATIAGGREYVLRGRRGSAPYLSFGTKANRYAIDGTMPSTGELDGADLTYGADGSFEIIVSETPKPGNWLAMAPDSTMLLVRETFRDRAHERASELTISRIGGPAAPPPLSAAAIDRGLAAAGQFATRTFTLVANWAAMVAQAPNSLAAAPYAEASMRAGGDPQICYYHGYWRLTPEEALVITTTVPECVYWNFQLANHWLESLDTRHRKVDINGHHARPGADGLVTLVVAAADPGGAHWLDTAGHDSGGMLLRWVGAREHPQPSCRVVPLASLRPAGG